MSSIRAENGVGYTMSGFVGSPHVLNARCASRIVNPARVTKSPSAYVCSGGLCMTQLSCRAAGSSAGARERQPLLNTIEAGPFNWDRDSAGPPERRLGWTSRGWRRHDRSLRLIRRAKKLLTVVSNVALFSSIRLRRLFSVAMSNQHALSPAAGPPAKRRRPTKKPAASQFSSGASTPPAPAPPLRAAAADLYNGVRFEDFRLSGQISQATASGIVHEFCTEVQAKTLPVILTGVDVCVSLKFNRH